MDKIIEYIGAKNILTINMFDSKPSPNTLLSFENATISIVINKDKHIIICIIFNIIISTYLVIHILI